jgi:hypothetical protein
VAGSSELEAGGQQTSAAVDATLAVDRVWREALRAPKPSRVTALHDRISSWCLLRAAALALLREAGCCHLLPMRLSAQRTGLHHCSAPSIPPNLVSMQILGLVTAVILAGIYVHLIFRVAPQRKRQETARRRLNGLRREAERPDGSITRTATTWRAPELRRYYVPTGLRLEQARRTIRQARENNRHE